MPEVYALFWFDVEDCSITQSDDAAKRLANILSAHRVRGTFKVVGQKARVMRDRVRYDVIDALGRHEIGFHSNWHGLRPQIAEYLADCDWDEGVSEFATRERPGLDSVRDLFGVNPVTYGQPGSNWAPHVFPVLREWRIPTYVSGYGYVGVDCQPFWYGGLICTSHMYGKRFNGEDQRHLVGLNFELGKPGELEKHKEQVLRSREQLAATGGLIHMINHPCTLYLEQWFSTDLKPRELTEAGFAHFEEFVKWLLSLDHVTTVTATDLLRLYADGALGRAFSRDELHALASALSNEITFQRVGDVTLSAAEAFGMIVDALASVAGRRQMPDEVVCDRVFNPTRRVLAPAREFAGGWGAFGHSVRGAAKHVKETGQVPNYVQFAGRMAAPHDYLAACARVLQGLLEGNATPDEVAIRPAPAPMEGYVDEAAAKSGWRGSMAPPGGLDAPKMIDLAKLQCWTLKPAISSSAEFGMRSGE